MVIRRKSLILKAKQTWEKEHVFFLFYYVWYFLKIFVLVNGFFNVKVKKHKKMRVKEQDLEMRVEGRGGGKPPNMAFYIGGPQSWNCYSAYTLCFCDGCGHYYYFIYLYSILFILYNMSLTYGTYSHIQSRFFKSYEF